MWWKRSWHWCARVAGLCPRSIILSPEFVELPSDVYGVDWSPDGRWLASASLNGAVRVWDVARGRLLHTFMEHTAPVYSVAWSPDGQLLASGAVDGRVRIWEAATGRPREALGEYHQSYVYRVAWSPDGQYLASSSANGMLQIWEGEGGQWSGYRMSNEHFSSRSGPIYDLAWSPDSRTLATAGPDGVRYRGSLVEIWDAVRGEMGRSLEGHSGAVYGVTWSPDGRCLASVSEDRTVRIWDAASGRTLRTLEGHTEPVIDVAWSPDGRLLATASQDHTMRIWGCDSWMPILTLPWPEVDILAKALAFRSRPPALAMLGRTARQLRVWSYDPDRLVHGREVPRAVHYITAKIVLVGDSGVGKTGLGWRLAYGTYKEHDSTHGQQFWVIEQLKHRRLDGAECEAVLWDFAGQPDYRLIHTLFLEDAVLALLLFDPANRQEPLRGVDYWLKALTHGQSRPCRAILVGARADVGDPAITPDEIDAFCRVRGITGGYVLTSAKRGKGMNELIQRIKDQISWDEMMRHGYDRHVQANQGLGAPPEGGPRTARGANRSGGPAPAAPGDRPELGLDCAHMTAAIEHLANYGYVKMIRTSSGALRLLLAPDVLNNLAALFVLEARRNPQGLGAMDEGLILAGSYNFPEIRGLAELDRQTLLHAATTLFLRHNLCFRESHGPSTYLIFPELINQKKPRIDGVFEPEDDVSYLVSGEVENVYAARWCSWATRTSLPGQISGRTRAVRHGGRRGLRIPATFGQV